MEKIIQLVKEKFNNLFTKLYLGNLTTIVTICWVVASFHITIIYHYPNCVNTYDEKNTFIVVFWLTLGTIFIVYASVIRFFLKNKKKIGIEKIKDIDEDNDDTGMGSIKPQVVILPMYLLWIFSLSKLIVILYQDFDRGISVDIIIKIGILSVIFIGSFWAWLSFKKTSTKSCSFWITIFAISYIFINICWEYFLPFLQSYFTTLNCVFKTIITRE